MKARDQLLEEYTDLFTFYSDQYTLAMGTNANIQDEAWVTAYQNIIDKTNMWSENSNVALDGVATGFGSWKNIVDGYLTECEGAYTRWQETVNTQSTIVQELMTNTAGKVNDVTTASDNLATDIVTNVIPTIESELSAVQSITQAYADQRDAIDLLGKQYVELMGQIEAAIAAAAAAENITIPNFENDNI